MGLTVSGLAKIFGAWTAVAEISFAVDTGEFVTLLGPSGCGKTTTLRCIAGLDLPSAGTIAIDGETVSDPAAGIFVPPHERRLGMVFQSYAIWPHLTVAENVAFPLTVRGLRDVASKVKQALEVVGLAELSSRRPSELSGGQQQRVALARAIVGEPRLLLFDEPLSNLDARLRDRTRGEIRRIQRQLGVPAVYVTHDQAEAFALSDRVIAMNAGHIIQAGTPRELYRAPASRFVAEFVGQANFLDLVPQGERWRLPDGSLIRIAEVDGAGGAGGERIAVLRPEAVRLMPEGAVGDAVEGNVLKGRVVEATYLGAALECVVEAAGTRLRALTPHELAPGADVLVIFRPEDCRLLPRG